MFPKRIALPRPPKPDSFAPNSSPEQPPNQMFEWLIQNRKELARQLGVLEAEVERLAFESICGNADDSQHVEKYDGSLGVTRAFVDTYQIPVGQLQWLDNLDSRFDGSGESPGDVAGARWCTGCMVSNDLFITAGHCFDRDGGGWIRPERNGQTIMSEEIATLMRVNFNYQINGANNQVRVGESFPVVELMEYREGGLDFAIARLGANADGVTPGEKYGRIQVSAQDLVEDGAMLCVIQHPNGSPKKVEAGPMRDNQGGRITYDSLDTLGGSSGAPVLSLAGELVGVHTNGGCSAFSGFNYGSAIGAIRAVSANLPGVTEGQRRAKSISTKVESMTKYTGEEFVKALTSEGGIPSAETPLQLVGMVKAVTGRESDSVLFALSGSCASWTPVPVKMIQSVEHLGKVPCRDHEHDYVRMHLKPPTTGEGRVLAAVLRQMETASGRADVGKDTQERWRPSWRPPQLPPITIPNPIQNVRCAQCIAVNIALGLAVAAAVAALGPAIGAATAVSSLMAQFGISEALAIAAVGGASGASMAHLMCQNVC